MSYKEDLKLIFLIYIIKIIPVKIIITIKIIVKIFTTENKEGLFFSTTNSTKQSIEPKSFLGIIFKAIKFVKLFLTWYDIDVINLLSFFSSRNSLFVFCKKIEEDFLLLYSNIFKELKGSFISLEFIINLKFSFSPFEVNTKK